MITILTILWLFTIPPIEYQQVGGWVAEPKVKAAMRYHGVLFAKSDTNGTLWFERKGRKCKLYTQAFETSWRK